MDEAAAMREFYYLLQVGNHVAIVDRTRNPNKATDLMQRCTDALTPMLQKAGLWPLEDSAHVSLEYIQRKEELISALEEAPREKGGNFPMASLPPALRISADYLLGPGPRVVYPIWAVPLLGGLFQMQVSGCKMLLEGRRLPWWYSRS